MIQSIMMKTVKCLQCDEGKLPGGLMALSANTYQAVISDYGLQRGDQLTFVVITANVRITATSVPFCPCNPWILQEAMARNCRCQQSSAAVAR